MYLDIFLKFLFILSGASSNYVYVNVNGTDQIDCGSIAQPCWSLSYAINHISGPNDIICLIASPIKQIKYSLEKQIIIEHNLTVTKNPLFSVNPVLTYPENKTSNWKKFYAFASVRSTAASVAAAAEILSLKFKSVSFNVNIFIASAEGCKTVGKNMFEDASGCPLSISISDSIISSPSLAISLSDLSESENFSILVEDSIIQSGRFMFKNKRESCKRTEHVKSIVKINNVSVLNTGIVALSVNGCFNISFNKLTCGNLNWEKQELFTFRGSLLKMKNVLIENILHNNNKLGGKTLFLLHKCAVEIDSILIKNCKMTSSMQLHEGLAVFLVQKSLVKMLNIAVVGNFLTNFARIENSILHINNITSSNNFFTGTLCSVQKSNLKLSDAKFYSNKVEFLIHTNSNVLITSNILNKNKIYKNADSIPKSIIQLQNAVFTKNNVMQDMLYLTTGSSAIIQNNTLTENNISKAMYNLFGMSKIQLNNAVFTRNNLMRALLEIQSDSSAIIQNNMLTENNVPRVVYLLSNRSNIQLNNIAFTQNNFEQLLNLKSHSNATIQTNTLTENKISGTVFVLLNMSNIQLTNVAFYRNSLMERLLYMGSISFARLKYNIFDGNDIHERVFDIHTSFFSIDAILFYNNTLMKYLISAISSYVSLDFMRIRENRFKSDIIYTENCNGKLTNTYIENYDYYSVSAIIVTWNYEDQEYFHFRIANNIILWNYKLNFSIQPIIKLMGTINIFSLNLSVSSKPDIAVLQYSTQDVVGREPFTKVFRNVYKISSLFISCRRANVEHIATLDTFKCTPCVRHTYTLNNGSLHISSTISKKEVYTFQRKNINFSCFDCPVGGDCSEYIKSKSNFYGYKTKQQKVMFLSCPLEFCCIADQCKTITSCNKGRSGTLCGRCIKNNTESFLSTNCVPVNMCKKSATFWLIYFVYAFSLATCLYYMKDLVVLIKTTGGNVFKVFQCFKKEKGSEDEFELVVDIVGAEEHPEKISNFTVSGIFALIVSFYQVKQ